MKYNEIIYSIREQIREIVDDSNIDNREIIFYVNLLRSELIRNQLNQRNRVIDEEIKQNLNVDLVTHEALCTPSVNVLRSTEPIPNTINLHHKNTIYKISSTDVTDIPFSLVSFNRFPFTGYDYPNLIYCTLDTENYLYLKSSNNLIDLMNNVDVTLILENPFDVQNFSDNFDLDTFDYPLKNEGFLKIMQEVIKILLNKLRIPEDTDNDAESR